MSWGVDEAWDELKNEIEKRVETMKTHGSATLTSGYAELRWVQRKMKEMEQREC